MTEPVIAKKEPIAVDLEAGKTYHWCTCGHSANQPFCDGSHEDTGFEPLTFTADESKTAFLCACKRTAGKPFCDGTHKEL